MRELNLKDYQVKIPIQNPAKGPEFIEIPYMVKDSILNIMFMPAVGLAGAALVRQNILAMKIETAKDSVMLEEEEYQRVVNAVNVYKSQSRADVELVDRILNQTPEI